MSKIVLGQNQYGKAEVRLVKITRDTKRHEIEDVTVTSQLRGDLDAVHTEGDNAHVVGRSSSTRGRGSRSTARATTIPSSDRATNGETPWSPSTATGHGSCPGSATWWC